ncbi:MAG TPA: M48 family metalloprotease, partial [Thermoanaerobaculia bacterium]|nr:M48 family metalloprotease [Thermoanaerobaculia bacterium]
AFALAALLALPVLPRPAAAQAVTNGELFAKSVEAAQQALEQYGEYDNPAEEARVNRIGYELAQQSGYTKVPFSFTMVDMPVPNAFALPGGQIFITRGMLDLGMDDDMLAAVLGHEIGHITLDHFRRMQRKQTLLNVLGNLMVVGMVVSESHRDRNTGYEAPYDPRVGYDPGGDRIQGAAAASVVIGELLLRSYSREHEDEADQEGQRLSALAGYDPDGARRVWEKMNSRAPQLKEYGYMQTHPFADERMRAAEARKGTWSIQPRKSADDFRLRTQAALMSWIEQPKTGQEKLGPEPASFLKSVSLAAWPAGTVAVSLRMEKLHKQRDEELAKPLLSRNYGGVLKTYRKELATVQSIDPRSDAVASLDTEIKDLELKRKELYPKALEILDHGVYETSFLESFLSNFPDSPRVPEVALALGDAYSRLGNATDAVARYLESWEAAPESPEGKKASTGLRTLASSLDQLAALQQLASQDRDPELKKMAGERLNVAAKSYSDVTNGAEYLRRFPEGEHVPDVLNRLNVLADNLYTEVVLYKGMGDSVKAMERINKILTHAPLSPAAERLRDQAVIGETKAG